MIHLTAFFEKIRSIFYPLFCKMIVNCFKISILNSEIIITLGLKK